MVRKVLIVEDSNLIQHMYKLLFMRYKDCELIMAMNGREGLDKLSQETGVELILLDINMPVMNGLQFLEVIKSGIDHCEIPVIIVSTEGKEEDTLRGLQMGANGYVKKPFQPSDLFSLIQKVISDSPAVSA